MLPMLSLAWMEKIVRTDNRRRPRDRTGVGVERKARRQRPRRDRENIRPGSAAHTHRLVIGGIGRAFGRLAGPTVSELDPILTGKAWLPVLPMLSVARTVKLYDPLAVGIPVIAPVLASSAKPGGSVPDETQNYKGRCRRSHSLSGYRRRSSCHSAGWSATLREAKRFRSPPYKTGCRCRQAVRGLDGESVTVVAGRRRATDRAGVGIERKARRQRPRGNRKSIGSGPPLALTV